MLIDGNGQKCDITVSTDILIIGAGTLGLFLADYLYSLNDKQKIVLVESGGKIPSSDFQRSTISTGKPHHGCISGRASGIGGTSNLWGGQLSEFESSDLKKKWGIWLIPFQELAHYYKKVYQRLNCDDEFDDFLCRIKFGNEKTNHTGVERFFTRWLPQPKFARNYKNLIESQCVDLYYNTTVHDIEFNASIATKVLTITGESQPITFTFQQVIFACGTIATCQFFLNTQLKGGNPWANNNNIGKYFQDHLGGKIADVIISNPRKFRDYFENGFLGKVKRQPKLRFKSEFENTSAIGVSGFFSFDSSISQNLQNMKLVIANYKSGLTYSSGPAIIKNIFKLSKLMLPIIIRYIRDKRIFAILNNNVSFHVHAEQIANKLSCLTLNQSQASIGGMYPINVNWHCDGKELELIKKFALDSDIYLQDKGIGKLNIHPELLNLNPSFLHYLGDTSHQSGGMVMSENDSVGVVNKDCKVWGTDNVWVAGSSVFPSSSYANITLTALALSARIAENIMSKHENY
jgi:hypothetical protein